MRLLLAFIMATWATVALAQNPTKLCFPPTNNPASCAPVAEGNPLPVGIAGSSFTNITTNTDTSVKASPGTLVGISINTGGTGSTVAIYNDADGTCSSGLIGTFATTAQSFIQVPAAATVGLCATTAGAAAADITVFYR